MLSREDGQLDKYPRNNQTLRQNFARRWDIETSYLTPALYLLDIIIYYVLSCNNSQTQPRFEPHHQPHKTSAFAIIS